MSLLREEDRQYLIKEFESLPEAVKLVVFTQEFECQYCRETRAIAEELASLSDKISVEVYDFVKDKAVAEQYGIDKVPALAVVRGGAQPKDYGIRFYGIPAGYEFTTLVEDIMMAARGESGLMPASKEQLARLTQPVHVQVFVTPTCPYCPQAVRLAHQLAVESDLVRADMVEAIEFPHLAVRYQVQGVPRTVINDREHIEGAAPEPMVLARLAAALR